jgi:DNA replicative helicase MCM subunit Mcm2 (Cdc46/Mcm family)
MALRVSDIRSQHLNEEIEIEGVIRQQSDVRPLAVSAKFECSLCGQVLEVKQVDKLSSCNCNNKKQFKPLSREFSDIQILVVEDLIETNPDKSKYARKIKVELKGKLTGPNKDTLTKPGSKVRIIGKLCEVPIIENGKELSRFDWEIKADNVESI